MIKYLTPLQVIVIASYFFTYYTYATSNPPHKFAVEIGSVIIAIKDHTKRGGSWNFDKSPAIKVGMSYHFTESWGVGATALGGLSYSTDLYTFEGIHTFPLNRHFSVDLSAGLVFGSTDDYSVRCREIDGSYYDDGTELCAATDSPIEEKHNASESSFTVGTAIRFDMSNHWSVAAGYRYGDFRDGYNQYDVSFNYRF